MAQHFDVAVVGMQMSGVITAALLAKRGRRVLLVDHGENTFTYRRQGRSLPLLPTLLPTLDQAPQVQKVHEELALGPELRAITRPLDPAFQAILPRHRLDVRSNREALLHELQLEFPDLVQPVQAFFDRLFALDDEITAFLAQAPVLPANSWWERLWSHASLAKMSAFNEPFESEALLSGIPARHPLRELLLGPLTFFGHLWSDAPSTLHAVRLIARYYRGVSTLDEGTGGLARLLLQAAERAGVTVRRGAVVRNVKVVRRKLVELSIEDDRMTWGADYFVSNTVSPFNELLAPEARHPRYLVEEQSVNATGSLLVLNMVVKKDVIPRGMGIALFLLNGRRAHREEDPADPPLFVQRFVAVRSETNEVRGNLPFNDDEHEVVSVACPVRVQEVAHSPHRLAAMKAQIMGRVRRVIPFLDDFLADVSLPIETTTWDADAEPTARRIDPWRLHPIYEPHDRPVLGVASRPARTYFKNLVHCGRDVMPGLGLEGEYIAGVNAATTLQRMAGRSWRLQ